MLILTRKLGECVVIGDDVKVYVMELRGNQARIGIEAPQDVGIERGSSLMPTRWAARTDALIEALDVEAGDLSPGRRVKVARLLLDNIGQRECATALGVSVAQLRAAEAGRNDRIAAFACAVLESVICARGTAHHSVIGIGRARDGREETTNAILEAAASALAADPAQLTATA